jgi:hypothetical protein
MTEHKAIGKGSAVSPLTIFIILFVCAVGSWIWVANTRTPKPLVVKEGQEYQMLCFGSASVSVPLDRKVKEEKDSILVETYVITFCYAGTDGSRRGTIAVPKQYLVRDLSLAKNRIVWEKSFELEGMQYRLVRWNPGHMVPNSEAPVLKEEAPLRE